MWQLQKARQGDDAVRVGFLSQQNIGIKIDRDVIVIEYDPKSF